MDSHSFNKLTKRDTLALDRTRLANHRTILAYMRTVIILAGSGITLIKLFPDDTFLLYLGLAFFPLAVFFLVMGTAVFFKTKKKLKGLYSLQADEKS